MRVLGVHERPDVERFSAPGRDPFVIDADDFLDGRFEDPVRKRGNAEPAARFPETRRVAVGPEDANLVVHPAKRLQPFEHRLPVVQGEAPRMQGYRREGNDLRVPPCAVAIAKAEHVVGEVVAEAEPGRVDLRTAARRGALDPKVVENGGHFGFRGAGGATIHDARSSAARRRGPPEAPWIASQGHRRWGSNPSRSGSRARSSSLVTTASRARSGTRWSAATRRRSSRDTPRTACR